MVCFRDYFVISDISDSLEHLPTSVRFEMIGRLYHIYFLLSRGVGKLFFRFLFIVVVGFAHAVIFSDRSRFLF